MGDHHKVRERCVPASSLANKVQPRRGAAFSPGTVSIVHVLPRYAGQLV